MSLLCCHIGRFQDGIHIPGIEEGIIIAFLDSRMVHTLDESRNVHALVESRNVYALEEFRNAFILVDSRMVFTLQESRRHSIRGLFCRVLLMIRLLIIQFKLKFLNLAFLGKSKKYALEIEQISLLAQMSK